MKCVLIRHGKTPGNAEHRYIGMRSDEALSPLAAAELSEFCYPMVDRVFASPMRRCLQTAALIYPKQEIHIVSDLRECDFGEFEGRNYDELKELPAYRAWLESGGRLPFPNGESRGAFSKRCADAYLATVRDLDEGSYAFVVHGGTIMAIMERFARPRGDYYDFQVKNGKGFVLMDDGSYEVL